MNPLSEGIINADGSPGPNLSPALQYQASDTTTFNLTPTKTGPYTTLPPPNTDGASLAASDTNPPPFATIAAAAVDDGLLRRDIRLLTAGATDLPADVVDTRIIKVASLPSGPFQLTPGVPYDAYAASPVHHFTSIRTGSSPIARRAMPPPPIPAAVCMNSSRGSK